jgi:hypothetical protein
MKIGGDRKMKTKMKKGTEKDINKKEKGNSYVLNSKYLTKSDVLLKSSFLLLPFFFLLSCFFFTKLSFAHEREGGISVGAYGSTRLEISKDTTTFTLRRIVPTFSATVKERLRFYTELEFERFGLIELQENLSPQKEKPIEMKTEIEGSRGSEIKLEQMWGEFEYARPLRFRVGAILPPIGRFNILHDDDLWEPARRPLSVRDRTVLPEKVAWTEIGLGFTGNFDIGNSLSGYELYVVNGVTLEHDIEFYLSRHEPADNPPHNMLKVEGVIKPRFGNFALDSKKEKALTGRFFFAPALGHEIGISGYFGRYTPAFLPSANVWTAAFDFKTEVLPFLDMEGEYAYTQFQKLSDVMAAIGKRIYNKEVEVLFQEGATDVKVEGNTEIELEMTVKKDVLADVKHGGWVLIRLKFFPSFLKNTPLYLDDASKFVLFLRPEIVSFSGLISKIEIEEGKTELEKKSDLVFRITPGLAYRPTDTWVFSISYEITKQKGNPVQNVLLFGFAFGL